MKIFQWFFAIVQLVFMCLLFAGCANVEAQRSTYCPYGSYQSCQDAYNVGAGVGFFMILFAWAVVDVILGVIWLVAANAGKKVS